MTCARKPETPMQCKAKSKQSGERCKKAAVPTYEVCEMHGGKTPRGFALPQTTHGGFSKDLPTRLAADFQAALDDPNLLELRQDLALVDARLHDLLKRVDTGEAGVHWRRAQKLLADMHATDDATKQQQCLIDLEATIGDGASDYAAWDEVTKLVAQRQRLVESERKRLVDLRQMITTEKAMLLIANISSIIQRHVTDRSILSKIAHDLNVLTAGDAGRVIDVGDAQ